MIFDLLAEGYTEEIIASQLLPFCGHELGIVYGKRGCAYIKQKATFFHHRASEYSGVLILTDYRDSGSECIPVALNDYILSKLPHPPKTFVFNFAVNEIESWLLADCNSLALYLGVAKSHIPQQPENEDSPKRTLINIARVSKIKKIREGIAPPIGHISSVGPTYQSLIQEYIQNHWNIQVAMNNSKSLKRCINKLKFFNNAD